MLLQICRFAYWSIEKNKRGCKRKLSTLLVSTSIYTKLWVRVQNVHFHLFLNTWAREWRVLVHIRSGLLTLYVSMSYKNLSADKDNRKVNKQNKKRKCNCKLNSKKDYFFLHHLIRPSFHSCPKRIYFI